MCTQCVCMLIVELLIHHMHMKGHLLFETLENHVPKKYNNNNNNITVFIWGLKVL